MTAVAAAAAAVAVKMAQSDSCFVLHMCNKGIHKDRLPGTGFSICAVHDAPLTPLTLPASMRPAFSVALSRSVAALAVS